MKKTILLLIDGLADYPSHILKGMTPLEYAYTPYMDMMARCGRCLRMKTIFDEERKGSEYANLRILGYDTENLRIGRAYLEALGLNLTVEKEDVCFRANLVEITNGILTNPLVQDDDYDISLKGFYKMTKGKYIVVDKNGERDFDSLPDPYAYVGKNINELEGKLLTTTPNKDYRLWIWSESRHIDMENFLDRQSEVQKAVVVAGAPLIIGIAKATGMEVVTPNGADGTISTNLTAKAECAIDKLKTADFVFLHIEAADEASHIKSPQLKAKLIEDIDREVVAKIVNSIKSEHDEIQFIIMPDHYCSSLSGCHTTDVVPLIIYPSQDNDPSVVCFSERELENSPLIESIFTI